MTSCPLNDLSIPITKSDLVIMYPCCFHTYCTLSHSYDTLSASKRIGMMRAKFIFLNFPILFKHPREKISNHSGLVEDL